MVSRKILIKPYFCNIFLYLLKINCDAAGGEPAAPSVGGAGRDSEQLWPGGTLAVGLFSPPSLPMDCNILTAKCPRIIFLLRKPWKNVPSKYRRAFINSCLPVTSPEEYTHGL